MRKPRKIRPVPEPVVASDDARPAVGTDRVLALSGLVLAAAAAFFPWYVFFNADKFGIRSANWDGTRDLPDLPPRNVFSVSPMAMTDNSANTAQPLDNLTTATVGNEGKKKHREMEEAQPFPGRTDFRLLHVANGRALIEDSSGMYMVKGGSILPDESRVATLEQRSGKWVIVTSNGKVYQAN